jgi:acyl carrier protein
MKLGLAGEVAEVVARRMSIDDRRLEPATRFVDDLGADSLAIVELTLDLEETFDVEIEDGEVAHLQTVQAAVECIERARARQRS